MAFIGSAGIPNRYGGFESFLEHCSPIFANAVESVVVTCDASLYKDDLSSNYYGVQRIFINVKANGAASILHDLLAFLRVYRQSTHIIVLGVSGGLWFPLFKLLCRIGCKRLGVNVDGVEWRRTKFSRTKQHLLRVFDYLAQRFSDVVVYDNAGLSSYIYSFAKSRSVEIGYSGDHVLRRGGLPEPASALTICRIEPENNIELLIKGVLGSNVKNYTIVGNWNKSSYGRNLRERYDFEPRLNLLDPIYDANHLALLRESCAIYLHGHSVGGTNPSLVEMLYYDCILLCLNNVYNQSTASDSAHYFSDSMELAGKVNEAINGLCFGNLTTRESLRLKYSREIVVDAYLHSFINLDEKNM